ncbi:unnamed protein product [Calypogeia fissa]
MEALRSAPSLRAAVTKNFSASGTREEQKNGRRNAVSKQQSVVVSFGFCPPSAVGLVARGQCSLQNATCPMEFASSRALRYSTQRRSVWDIRAAVAATKEKSAKVDEMVLTRAAQTEQSEQKERQIGRRQAFATMLVLCSVPIVLTQIPGALLAEEEAKEAEKKDEGVLGGLLSLFDPNETTKQGKKLPKAYLKSARDVVQTLRASFSEDSQNEAQFRRNADSAKGAIRDYISSWRGAKLVGAEDSYQALERVLRGLSEFYSKRGPSAVLPEDVRARILEDLQKADDAL